MNRIKRILGAVLGWEATSPRPPATGVDRKSARHFVALVMLTLAIMAGGLIAAAVQWSSPAAVVGTPTPIEASATAAP